MQNLLSKVLDRAQAIEAVNITGGRLIREGKVRTKWTITL